MKPSLRLRSALLGGLLAGAFTAQATNPVLTFRGLTTTGDNTAFIDQVQILSGATGSTVVASAIVNGSFESFDPLANGTYGYVPTGAVWNFGNGSGIAIENTGFTSPDAIDGTRMAFLQGGSQFQQTLTLPAGATLYRVRFRVVQRFFSTPPAPPVTNVQKVQVLVDGAVVIDNVQPTVTTFTGNTNAYTYTTATFTVGASTPFALTALAPTRNALGVARTNNYVAQTFSEAVNPASVYNGSIFSSQYGGELKMKQPIISGNQVTYVPDRFFKAGEVVSVTVPNTVVSNALGQASNNAQVYQFTVATQNNNVNNGVFSGGLNSDVGTDPRATTMADVDGDGRLDLIVASNLSVSVFRNTGNSTTPTIAPTFDIRTILLLPTNSVPLGVAVGDVDGDGRLDIVTANSGPNNISIFRNTGTTTGAVSFATGVQYGTGLTPYAVALGDLDADGDLDIVTANYDNDNVSVLRNVILSAQTRVSNGLTASTALSAASFSASVSFPTGNNPTGVALGDMDSDGQLDIIAVSSIDNNASVLLNTTASPAALSFAARVNFTAGNTPYGVAVGDINKDGKLDIVTANRISDNVSVIQNSSTGPGSITASTTTPTSINVGNDPRSVVLGDVNGDGSLDIVVANYDGNNGRTVSTIFRNAANTAFMPQVVTTFATVDSGPRGVALGDVDGDGDLDFITANQPDDSFTLRINGTSAAVLPLPVELVSFAAKCTGTGTLLMWRTASEKNSAGFDVQRSADGKSFASIATVESQGNSTSGGTYTTNDERASGQAYYRLRMVDTDGTTTYSPVATASCATQLEAAAGLTLVPNPAQGRVQVLGTTEAVQLLDLTGRVVRQQAAAESLSLEGLAPGIYLVRSGKHTARLQVQ